MAPKKLTTEMKTLAILEETIRGLERQRQAILANMPEAIPRKDNREIVRPTTGEIGRY